jgi:hypothetical protein
VEHLQQVDANALPEAVAQYRQLVAIVQSILQCLPGNRQRAVRQHLQGLITAEIAELMGWGEAKDRNSVYRGLDDLRRGLRAQGVDYKAGSRGLSRFIAGKPGEPPCSRDGGPTNDMPSPLTAH